MTVDIRRFTPEGIAAARQTLQAWRDGHSVDVNAILNQKSLSESIGASIEPPTALTTRMDLARHVTQAIGGLPSIAKLEGDIGLWTWLGLLYSPFTCPADAKAGGRPIVGEDYRHVLSSDHRHRYRHLVRSSFLVWKRHGKNGRVILGRPVHRGGEAQEQLLSREHVFSCAGAFEAVDTLYVRTKADGSFTVKRGAAGGEKSPGTFRRFGSLVRQLDLTYDLHSMDGQQILGLLPKEFDKFRLP